MVGSEWVAGLTVVYAALRLLYQLLHRQVCSTSKQCSEGRRHSSLDT